MNRPTFSSFSPAGGGQVPTDTMTIGDVALAFMHSCDTGMGWQACEHLCEPDASFVAQCDQLAGVADLRIYCDWVRDLLKCMPDSKYEVRSLGIDDARNNVTIFAVLTGTHTAEGGPMAPTGKAFSADYVYALEFSGNRIRHLTKIWNDPWTLKELGWA